MLGDRLTDGCIGGIDAVCLVQRIEYMVFALESVQIQAVIVSLHGYLHVLEEEFFLVLAQSLQKLHILDRAVHHRAAVGRYEAIGKIIAALDRALKQRAAVFAKEACHIICGHFH